MSLTGKIYEFNDDISASYASRTIMYLSSTQPQQFFTVGNTSYKVFHFTWQGGIEYWNTETRSQGYVVACENVDGTLVWTDDSYKIITFLDDPNYTEGGISTEDFETWILENTHEYVPTQEYLVRTFVMPDGNRLTFRDFEASSGVSNFPQTGKDGIIYLDTSTNLLYKWSGNSYVRFNPDVTGATSSAAGRAGLVPAPSAGDETKYLKGNGTWANAPVELPSVSSADNGKFLQVSNGAWAAVAVLNANGVSF